ncbi:MAG: alpha/beta fold hydrolase [Rhodospirillaceae bacterium]
MGPGEGHARDGKVLLLPGLMCDARIWAPQVALDPARIIAVDGYGGADSIAGMARRVLAAAPDTFAVAGHSMGARVALELYRMAPERIERLALIDTGVHGPRPGEAEKRHALLDLGRREGIDRLLDVWLPPMVAAARRTDAALLDALRAMCRAAGVDTYAAQIRALLGRPEAVSLLSRITCPTLVAVGRQDEWSPLVQHQEIAAAIPSSTLEVFEDCGHMSPAEAPAQVNAALARWLAQ